MAGEWECSICGKINLDEDPFCIECYQDRADVEIKPVNPQWLPKTTEKNDEVEEDDEDENEEDY
jgi:hypothetical protein